MVTYQMKALKAQCTGIVAYLANHTFAEAMSSKIFIHKYITNIGRIENIWESIPFDKGAKSGNMLLDIATKTLSQPLKAPLRMRLANALSMHAPGTTFRIIRNDIPERIFEYPGFYDHAILPSVRSTEQAFQLMDGI